MINAYEEIFGNTIVCRDEASLKRVRSLESCDIKEEERENFTIVTIIPHIDSAPVQEWINDVKFAKIQCNGFNLDLHSYRSKEDELNFLQTLKEINYDNGYGSQELFGVIVFKNNSWMERWEYDGSESWTTCVTPKEEDYFD